MTAQAEAVRAGAGRGLDALVAECLPLVYSIVRRTLPSATDVDDVVQDTMVRVARASGGLSELDGFRSWLVAITVSQLREHDRQRHHATGTPPAEYDDQPELGAEFVDRALTRLALSQQRRELEPALRWLGREDRELLSLWSLECGGHLTRAEIVSALELDARTVAVRLSRLKTRLDAVRMLVRACSATPRCPELVNSVIAWTGEPNPLWRKYFVEHVRACELCRAAGADLVPVQRLLLGVDLLAIPAGYTARLLSAVHNAVQSDTIIQFGQPTDGPAHQAVTPLRLARRVSGFLVAKPAVVVAGVTAACVVATTPVVVTTLAAGDGTAPLVTAQTLTTVPTPGTTLTVPSIVPTSPAPISTPTTTSASPPRTTAATTTTNTKAAPSSPSQASSAAQPLAAQSASSRLITLLNERRSRLGLPEVTESPRQVRLANDCARQNLRAATVEHCGHEVLFKGHKDTTPETMIDAWFTNDVHRTVLTYASSRNAGGSIVVDSGGTLIAAINIDY